MGEISSVIAMRPVTFFIVLTIVVLLLPSIVIPYWYHLMEKIEHNVEMEARYTRCELVSKIEDMGKLILPSNSSANDLTRLLGLVLENKHLSFSEIQTKVAQSLFEARLLIPHLTQVSYIGLDGLFFSYLIDGDKTYAVYSNSSFASNSTGNIYTWYTQPAKYDTGVLYDEAKLTKAIIVVKETWFQTAMSSPNGYASLGFRWTSNPQDEPDLFLDTASTLGGVGAISLGFAIKEVIDLFSGISLNGGRLFMATLGDGKVLLDGINGISVRINGDKALVHDGGNNVIPGEISCKSNNDAIDGGGTTLDMGGTNLIFHCSRIDIARVPLVYVLAFPSNGLVSNVHKHTKVALMLLMLMMVAMVISIFAFVALIVRAARREVHLCAAYMRQMEKTSQAERKSMKQSLAFASANHDVRGYLACIKGLIDLSYNDVSLSSELSSNLRKIDNCSEDLLALVNSILDFSKIEAGKMELEEKEFDLAQLLEDIADLHHPVAMKKGVEVILDPCDGSVLKFSHVKGDRGKLKQILSNLLSNAVKFTSQGHISIRAWTKKPSLENSIIASNKNSLLNHLSRFFYKNKKAYDDVEEMRSIKQDPNCMEFEFEVEDTGLGIPHEKRQSIFENFVQVKENSAGQIGTGLGLGIVQSLVRLMGGDIEIVDKADGEKGTCFKFNIFLISQENNAPMDDSRQDRTGYQDTNTSSGLSTCARSPRVEGSIVVLLIKNNERRKMVQRYMESLGVKLLVVRQVSQLSRTLKKKLKPKLNVSQYYSSSSGRLDLSPNHRSLGGAYLSGSSNLCRGGPKLLPLATMDGVDDILPVYKKASLRRSVKCVLLTIDANAGDFLELRRSVAEFRKDHLRTCIKVVWLERPDTRKAHFGGLQDESLPPTDCIISEPLHGSRLSRVLGLLPEFGGELLRVPSMRKRSNTVLPSNPQTDIEELYSSSGDQRPSSRERNLQVGSKDDDQQEVDPELESSSGGRKMSHREIQEIVSAGSGGEKSSTRNKDGSSSEKPLQGKKFLVTDDDEVIKMVARLLILNLGGSVDLCQNGKEALEIVGRAMQDQIPGASRLPYDYILMETEMEDMKGYEATKLIRIEEGKYGIHIPILGLTFDASSAKVQRIVEGGMDLHLTIPLTKNAILEAIRNVDKKCLVGERRRGLQTGEIQNNAGGPSSNKPLEGKKFLIAEDFPMLRKVAESFLTRLGASIEVCENGSEAFKLISKALSNLTGGAPSKFLYDYVLMDCQMPVMDGFEATRRIREEERKYNIHIPIIALTAHEGVEEGKKIAEAGMDFHLTKPLRKEELLETMRLIDSKFSQAGN